MEASCSTNEKNVKHPAGEQQIDFPELVKKVWASRRLILKICAAGAFLGLIMGMSIPKEYTANILIAPESNSIKAPASSISNLAKMVGIRLGSASETDAIYPSLHPYISQSTPFLVGLFDLPVHMQKDSIVIPLVKYMKEYQRVPWWRNVTSAPSQLIGWILSLFKEEPEEADESKEIDLFQLTPEQAGIVRAIGSRIHVTVEKKTLMITISVSMQDPLIAATVADSVRTQLQRFVTEYRTKKARINMDYAELLYEEAQAEYYDVQNKYTRYADSNRGLVRLSSRAELERLQDDMRLALSVYNQMNQQMQLARAKVEEITPVYTIIQPALVPLHPSKPNKMIIIVGCIFLSGVGSIGWVLVVKDLIKRKNKYFAKVE